MRIAAVDLITLASPLKNMALRELLGNSLLCMPSVGSSRRLEPTRITVIRDEPKILAMAALHRNGVDNVFVTASGGATCNF